MPSPAEHRRALSARGFTRLLDRLHPDSAQAGQEYERLRRVLVKFFDWRGLASPDECADEVLDRLAVKLGETAVEDVKKYALGIARLVALERRRGPAFSPIDETAHAAIAPDAAADDADPLRDCFDRCLDQLPEESRLLLLRYYDGERSVKISNRQRLASALGLTDNALRSRVQRLRDRLEQCVRTCSSQPMGHSA
jgi:DNA-directed RNA polymerase specialized sigma24 family protein